MCHIFCCNAGNAPCDVLSATFSFSKKRKKCHFALYSLRFSLTLQAESACKSFYTEIQETEISKNSYI